MIFSVVQTQGFCAVGLVQCCPTQGFTCGVRYPPVGNAQMFFQSKSI